MIESFVVTNHLGESIILELRRPEQSGLAVLDVTGLGPSKADIAMTKMSGVDGSQYNSARVNSRNVVFRLQFLPNPDIETSRQNSYKYFPLKRNIDLQINADNRTAHAVGYVETNEPDIFSSAEGCVISILFPEAYLFDVVSGVTVFASVTPLFEFPFSNESLVTPLLEMSELELETEKTVLYEGDAQVGMVLHIHATGAANDVSITNSRTLEVLGIDSAILVTLTGSDIIIGDDFWISTVKGNKYAILIRAAATINILSTLLDPIPWFQLEKGDNIFAYTADSGLANLEFEIMYELAYEGI